MKLTRAWFICACGSVIMNDSTTTPCRLRPASARDVFEGTSGDDVAFRVWKAAARVVLLAADKDIFAILYCKEISPVVTPA